MYANIHRAHNNSMITRFIIYGALGCLMEVLWTGLSSLTTKNFKLSSTTSLWMFFVYGMVAFLEPVFRLMAPMPFLLRGFLYAICIFAGEFLTGSILKRLQVCPWDYSSTKFHVKGLIRIDYLPAWIVAGLVFERVYWMIV
ncbi:MAG: putative ABC transporter permease [Defluviitaleaceae bacterium]|nr:putative ABC transporter permease [Defluviitaleaceae bacterium]